MYDMKHIGKYNVDYAGLSYDGGIPYQLVIIEEFDEHNKPTGNKKSLYFRCNRTVTEKYVMPDLSTEKKVGEWMGFKNYTKFQIFNCRMAEEVKNGDEIIPVNSSELSRMIVDALSDGYDDEENREEVETALYNELSQLPGNSGIRIALQRLCERIEDLEEE